MYQTAVNQALFLAQSITDITGLKTAVGRGLAIGVVFSFVYFVFKLWSGLTMDRHDGQWKQEIAKGIAVFGGVTIANILFSIFYPGQSILVQWS
jgi:hypothetical protein